MAAPNQVVIGESATVKISFSADLRPCGDVSISR